MTDTRKLADRIEDLLPQTQCTKCGFDGCRPYAEAIADGSASYNQCPPGGQAGIARIAGLLGKPAIPLAVEHGEERPRPLAVIDEQFCIGCTLCIQACPVDAIVGAPKQMHTVVAELCTGCDLCVPPCPVDCIAMIPVTGERTGWDARTQQQADAARARHNQHVARQRREREAAEARAAARRAASAAQAAQTAAPAASSADDPQAKKRAIIAAALERARKRRKSWPPATRLSNTEHVSPAVQAQIDAAEARRRRIEQERRAAEQADGEQPGSNDQPGGDSPTTPPRNA